MTAAIVTQNAHIDDQVHIASAQLPAAGAYTQNVAQDLPLGCDELAFVFSYTKHASATTGAFKAQLWWYFQGAEDSPVQQCYVDEAGVTVANPLATLNTMQLILQFENITASAMQKRVVTLRVPPGAVKFQLLAAETGDTTNRGTLLCRAISRKRPI